MRGSKGITLVALVVTIVVLLILAGISLSLVLGNNGIIAKAKTANEKYTSARTAEDDALNALNAAMEANLTGYQTAQ